ncbi:MAG: phosphonopyruvate decarboxylase [Lachnospiraceae bacterium]|jgi:phosphonopyruvate decarboxylase|nr:phosphonopyruvate decarboxylase [Lachnospiraceae bacterium]
MKVENLVSFIGADFYTGVPDSQLKPLCDYLMNEYGINGQNHIIAANEGNATAIAAGYYLSTGKIPVVYMQNSGEGNIINPLASLMHEKVYAIPCIFIIGWRGEPGIHDEPQHIYQGEITCKLLEDMGVDYFVIGKETQDIELKSVMERFKEKLLRGQDVAFIVRKGALQYNCGVNYKNDFQLTREEIIQHIVAISGEDSIISTTGKASRELFEIRERNRQKHDHDFLTVGSMGHASAIALGVALHKPEKRIWCIDGDGAALMHMGAMAIVGSLKPENLVHIVINNGSHETVGGMPTVAEEIDLCGIARACGYEVVECIGKEERLNEILKNVQQRKKLSFIEIKAALGARSNLGRPKTSPRDNLTAFMENLKNE